MSCCITFSFMYMNVYYNIGVLIRLTPSGSRRIQNVELNNENSFGWQGYSITKGFFRSETTEGMM